MGDPKISTILNRFLERGVAIRNYSPFTVKSYRDSWKLFIQVTKAEFISDLTKKLIEDFMFLGRTQRNWSTVTYHSHFKHYHSFLKWCVKEQYLAENPAADIEKPRIVKQLPRKLTKEAAARLLETSRTLQYHSDFERYRNHAIIACMLLAGLRRKEVIMLKMTDIDLVARELFVQQGKGNKDRVIPICDRLHGILSDYVGFKHQEGRYGTQFFTGINEKRPFGEKGIQLLIAKLRKATGLSFSAHTLRHSFATLMLEGGCDIYTLSNLMGHSKISTTTIYLQCNNYHKKRAIEKHILNYG